MSPLSIARAPHCINEAELGHSYFLDWRHRECLVFTMAYVTELKMFYKGAMCFSFCLAFCLPTKMLLL